MSAAATPEIEAEPPVPFWRRIAILEASKTASLLFVLVNNRCFYRRRLLGPATLRIKVRFILCHGRRQVQPQTASRVFVGIVGLGHAPEVGRSASLATSFQSFHDRRSVYAHGSSNASYGLSPLEALSSRDGNRLRESRMLGSCHGYTYRKRMKATYVARATAEHRVTQAIDMVVHLGCEPTLERTVGKGGRTER